MRFMILSLFLLILVACSHEVEQEIWVYQPPILADCNNNTVLLEISSCIQGSIFDNMNHQECEVIENRTFRDYCYYEFASLKSDPEICEEMTSRHMPFIDREYCILWIAKMQSNLSLCTRIDDEWSRDWCRIHIWYDTETVDVCDEIEHKTGFRNCVNKFEGRTDELYKY